ncbi:MAG: Uma2 family endonuclease [Polyangiaceae bacterium]|nr:Uma2 family endonuclease [Polyangiaceae bacterium]
MRASAAPSMNARSFLEWERDQKERHEYYRGEVFAMAGGSPRHNALCAAILGELRIALRGTGCTVLSSDQRISARDESHFVYADASAVCGTLELLAGTADVVTNPSVLVEVLSPSTAEYDRGIKWDSYQRLVSVKDFVLVSQDAERLEHYQRMPDGSWSYRLLEGGGALQLSHGTPIRLSSIYEGVFELAGSLRA